MKPDHRDICLEMFQAALKNVERSSVCQNSENTVAKGDSLKGMRFLKQRLFVELQLSCTGSHAGFPELSRDRIPVFKVYPQKI